MATKKLAALAGALRKQRASTAASAAATPLSKVFINFAIDPKLRAAVKKKAKASGLTVKGVIVSLLAEWVKK